MLIKRERQNETKSTHTLFIQQSASSKTLNLIGLKNNQSKSNALMKDFKAVNKFFFFEREKVIEF